jgi:N-acylneuraminate cytidylyltransferase
MIALIPARGGSKRIPGKNRKHFHGKPIIEYSILAAQQTGIFDHIYVSTDDRDTQLIAEGCGAKLTYRPPWLADDMSGTEDVMEEFIKRTNVKDDVMMCCIYATAPTMTAKDLVCACQMMVVNEADMAYSVDHMGVDAAQFYFAYPNTFKNFRVHDPGPRRIPGLVIKYVVENAIDINTPEDWEDAVRIYADVGG